MDNNHEHSHHAGAMGTKNMMALFSYLWILLVIPFLTDSRNDPFVKFHLKQGLTLLIFEIIGWVVAMFIWIIPFFGALILWLWWLASFVLAIIGILNVLNGVEKELPFIGHYGKNFSF